MTAVAPEDLVATYPLLYHMAEAGSWPSIQQIGLRTTTQLVDDCNVEPAQRQAILEQRRTESFTLHHPVSGSLAIRDQRPLREHNLVEVLTDLTVIEWLQLLNTHVFFWLHPQRLQKLLRAELYRNSAHDVVIVDTARLLAAHADRIRLTAMNTGATIFPGMPRRGSDTFMSVSDFPFEERRKSRQIKDAVVELAVRDGVADIADFTLRVERRVGPTIEEIVYEASP